MKPTTVRSCSVAGCNGLVNARGWCKKHYSRWQRHGNPLIEPSPRKIGLPCWVDGCIDVVTPKSARGLCSGHYQRFLLTGCPTGSTARAIDVRFFDKVRQSGECWEWTAALDDRGYGLFSRGGEWDSYRTIRSHIWSYNYFIGIVPGGLELDHLCHSKKCTLGDFCPHRRCVNPWHLEPVPRLVNVDRGRAAKRSECPAEHKYDLANTYVNTKGAQVCRICMAAARARYERKMRIRNGR